MHLPGIRLGRRIDVGVPSNDILHYALARMNAELAGNVPCKDGAHNVPASMDRNVAGERSNASCNTVHIATCMQE